MYIFWQCFPKQLDKTFLMFVQITETRVLAVLLALPSFLSRFFYSQFKRLFSVSSLEALFVVV